MQHIHFPTFCILYEGHFSSMCSVLCFEISYAPKLPNSCTTVGKYFVPLVWLHCLKYIYKTELLSQKYKLKPVVRVVIFAIHTAIMWDAFQGLQCKYVGSWGCRSGNESCNSKIYTDGKFLIQECQ